MATDPERAGDNSDMESVEDEDDKNTLELSSEILRRSDVLAVLQDRISGQGMEVFDCYATNYKQFSSNG